jgi:hypothetical protein
MADGYGFLLSSAKAHGLLLSGLASPFLHFALPASSIKAHFTSTADSFKLRLPRFLCILLALVPAGIYTTWIFYKSTAHQLCGHTETSFTLTCF